MKEKEAIADFRTKLQRTVLITAIIAAKIIAGGIAIRGLANLPKNMQNTYKNLQAVSAKSPAELKGFAKNIVTVMWDKEKWQAETDAILSVNAELKQANKAMETMDFDNAYEHLDAAQKMWAAAIKKFGRSKESTELLNIIINLKQKNRVIKINYLAAVTSKEVSQEMVKIAGRLKTIKGTEEAVDQIARLSEIQDELMNIKKDMLKLSKQEQDKNLLGMIEQLSADCNALIAELQS